jgi:DNA polymerase III sliding clamp (beta) subunit (PCNA family)
VEGRFPDWGTFLPQSFAARIRAGAAALLGALDRAALVAGKPPVAQIRIEGGFLAVEAAGDDGRLEERLPLEESEGEPLEAAFNPVLMAEALRALPSGEAEIAFSGPLSAAMFRLAGGGDDCFSLLLPVRLL